MGWTTEKKWFDSKRENDAYLGIARTGYGADPFTYARGTGRSSSEG